MYPIETINTAFYLYNKGYSYSQISKEIKPTRQTISIWINKYMDNLLSLKKRFDHYTNTINRARKKKRRRFFKKIWKYYERHKKFNI